MCIRPALLSFLLAGLAGGALAGQGLKVREEAVPWPQWQARLTLGTTSGTPGALPALADGATAQRGLLQSGALMGDYYFDAPGLRLPAFVGGLRASSGLMVGARGLAQGLTSSARTGQRFGLAVQSSAATAASDSTVDAVPYLGLGYTGLALNGGLSITADLGLVAERPGSASRALLGTQGTERAWRELRLSPVLQLGVSYAF